MFLPLTLLLNFPSSMKTKSLVEMFFVETQTPSSGVIIIYYYLTNTGVRESEKCAEAKHCPNLLAYDGIYVDA